MSTATISAAATAAVLAASATGQVTWTTDKAAWEAGVGDPSAINRIDWASIPTFTVVTEQFAGLGVHFTDGDDRVVTGGAVPAPMLSSFTVRDGLPSSGEFPINISFDAGNRYFGFRPMQPVFGVQFYSGATLIQELWIYGTPFQQADGFLGFTSTLPFDRIVALPVSTLGLPFDSTSLGNVSFAVPAPGSVMVFMGCLVATRRRREA